MTLTAEPPTAPVDGPTPVGPPPPFDPELVPALRIINELIPAVGPDTLQTMRAGIPGMEPVDNETLARDGAFLVEERTVPGPAGGVAGSPGPRDPGWPWTPVGPDGGELWLEREGMPHPIDAMVLERAAAAVGSVRRRSPGRPARGRAEADVAILLDPAASVPDRSAAAQRLHLSPTTQVRAVATASGTRIEPAGDPGSAVGRAGIGPAGSPDELPGSAAAARLALRFSADGTPADPGPRVVHARDLGGLLVLASAIGPQTARHADVVGLEESAGEHPWLLATLTAVAEQSSLRAAAGALHVHHSTLQERIAHAERMLGWSFGDPSGRFRLQIALALRRLHRTAAG